MIPLLEKNKISYKDLLYNIISNVTYYYEFNENSLHKHEEILEKRKLMFSDSSKYYIDDLTDISNEYLKKRLYKLRKNIKQNIDLRSFDRFWVVCVISTLITTIVTSYLTFNNLANVGVLNIVPISIFTFKCLTIEKSTKRYNVIYNYLIERKKQITDSDDFLIEDQLPKVEIEQIVLESNDAEKKVLHSCIYYLKKDELIDIKDSDIEKECLESLTNKLLTTQTDFTRLFSNYIKNDRIILKGKYKAISECIASNMYQKNGLPINSSSFEVQSNKILKMKIDVV